MANSKITFPITSKGVRRNAETGVEIRSTKLYRGSMEHTVYAPGRDRMRLINYFETLTSARECGIDHAERMRDQREADHSDAIDEHAERIIAAVREADHAEAIGDDLSHARKQFPSVFAMIEGNEVAAESPSYVRVVIGSGMVLRHVETGVEIGKFPGQPYAVCVPLNKLSVEAFDIKAEHRTLAAAKAAAFASIIEMRTAIVLAHEQAIALDAESSTAPTAADTDPEIATEVAEANGLDGYDKAEAIRDAIPALYRTGDVLTAIGRSMTSLRPADALRHAERARDLVAAREYRKPETDAKRVMMGMLATACGFPEIMRAWATRHGMSQDGYTIEGLTAAYDADHAEALRFEWQATKLAEAGVTAETHIVKFDGTVLPR